MPQLRVFLFGQPGLEVDRVPRKINRRKVLALLAYLVLADRPRTRDELAELLYPRLGRDRAHAGLRRTLSYLRAATGDGVVQVSDQRVALADASRVQVDVADFRALISRARGSGERKDLDAAVKLYRGAFLHGFFLRDSPGFEEWQRGLADELGAEYAVTLARLHDLYLQQSRLGPAIDCARSIVRLDPLDEGAQRRLMGTLAAAGRKPEAIRQFESLRAVLCRELHAEPETETLELVSRIRGGEDGSADGSTAVSATGGRATSRDLTVGVLPFDNLSGDPADCYFCDGLTDDLHTALSSVSSFRMAARRTMYTCRGKAVDARGLRRDLGVRYVVCGSVRKVGSRVRVNSELISTESGNVIWARKYDRDLRNIFEIQDDIVQSIVTELDVHLLSGEQARPWRASTRNAEAYDRFLRATDYTANPEGLARSVALLDDALALDPDFTAALCWKAIFQTMQSRLGWVNDDSAALRSAQKAADKAITVDPRYADAHAVRGMLLYVAGKAGEARTEYELALSLGPTMETTNSICAAFCDEIGDYPRALALIRRAKEYSRSPASQTIAWEIVILRNMGRLGEARELALQSLKRWPNGLDILVNYANVVRLMKRQNELDWAIHRILEVQPGFSSRRWVEATGAFTAEEATRYAAQMQGAGFPP